VGAARREQESDPMESRNLYEDDLTEERQPTPAMRDDVARTEILDPDILGQDDEDDDEDEVDDDEDDDEDDDD
jgi:hypothetical protein